MNKGQWINAKDRLPTNDDVSLYRWDALHWQEIRKELASGERTLDQCFDWVVDRNGGLIFINGSYWPGIKKDDKLIAWWNGQYRATEADKDTVFSFKFRETQNLQKLKDLAAEMGICCANCVYFDYENKYRDVTDVCTIHKIREATEIFFCRDFQPKEPKGD